MKSEYTVALYSTCTVTDVSETNGTDFSEKHSPQKNAAKNQKRPLLWEYLERVVGVAWWVRVVRREGRSGGMRAMKE